MHKPCISFDKGTVGGASAYHYTTSALLLHLDTVNPQMLIVSSCECTFFSSFAVFFSGSRVLIGQFFCQMQLRPPRKAHDLPRKIL